MGVQNVSGIITLRRIANHLPMLGVACNRRDRSSRLHTDRLIAKDGPALPIPDLRRMVAADWPRMQAGHVHDVCGGHFLGLASM
jgi:hypothetical protein